LAGPPHHLQRRFAEAKHARGADRVRVEHAARWVDRQVAAELLVAAIDRLPALVQGCEAEVLEPHRLVPGERDVETGDLDLLPRILDAGLVIDPLGARTPGERAHLVATGDVHRLGEGRAGLDPGGLARALLGELLGREHDRDRAVRRWAGLEIADRV